MSMRRSHEVTEYLAPAGEQRGLVVFAAQKVVCYILSFCGIRTRCVVACESTLADLILAR
jgi:hypothetical protein